MASDVRLGSLYLIPSGGSPTRGGSPTAASTTPFSLLQDGGWTPQAPIAEVAYSGGPPFRNGSAPAYAAYANVTESIMISVAASSHNNLADLIQQLRQTLNTALYSAPCVLLVQPNGATNALYADIYYGEVQETYDLMSPIGGFLDVSVKITYTRSAFFGEASLQTTSINATVFTNDGVSGLNTKPYGTLSGDMINEGSPLNISIRGQTADFNDNHALASCRARTYSALTGSFTGSVTTDTGVIVDGTGGVAIADMRSYAGIKARFLAKINSASNPTKCQIRVHAWSDAGHLGTLYRSPWTAIANTTSTQWVDLGGAPLDPMRLPQATSSSIYYSFSVRSSDGSSFSIAMRSTELLLYHEFCLIGMLEPLTTGTNYLQVVAAKANAGGGYLPAAVPIAYLGTFSTGELTHVAVIRGQVPRYHAGASLYWATFVGGDTSAIAGDTIVGAKGTITASHAKLFRSLAGSA